VTDFAVVSYFGSSLFTHCLYGISLIITGVPLQPPHPILFRGRSARSQREPHAEYATLVTVPETLVNPYLYFMTNPSTGLENILVYTSVNGAEMEIMGCTPELIANYPPKTIWMVPL
jgi:hypothetical protein